MSKQNLATPRSLFILTGVAGAVCAPLPSTASTPSSPPLRGLAAPGRRRYNRPHRHHPPTSRRTAAASLGDLLRASGCAELKPQWRPAVPPSLYLRAGRAKLLLIDGVRHSQSPPVARPGTTSPFRQIRRVPKFSGPASAICGSDAVGGVVVADLHAQATSVPQVSLNVGAGNISASASSTLPSPAATASLTTRSAPWTAPPASTPLDVPGSFSYVPDRWTGAGTRPPRLGAQLSSEHRAELDLPQTTRTASTTPPEVLAPERRPRLPGHQAPCACLGRRRWRALRCTHAAERRRIARPL